MSQKKLRRFAKRFAAVSMGVVLASGMLVAPSTAWNVYADSIDYEDRDNEKKNVMYYGDWSIWGGQGTFYPGGIPADQLTHLNFAFLDFDANGNLIFTDTDAAVGAPVGMPNVTWGDSNAGILNALQDLRAKNPNMRVGVSLGGWSKSGDFSPMAADPVARANFVNNVMKFIKYTGMDFVDLDWEYPNSARIGDPVDNTQDEGTPLANPSDVQNYITLLQDLRDALDEQGEELGKTYELSVALPASPSTLAAGIDVDALFSVVDFANIMTYDLHGAWDTITGHHTSLYTNPADPNAALGLSVDDAVQYLISEGAPSEKIVIGAAFYTRGWHEVTDDGGVAGMPGLFGSAAATNRNANASYTAGANNDVPLVLGGGGMASGVWAYRNLDLLLASPTYPNLQYYWDAAAQAPYLYGGNGGGFFTFDDLNSIAAKTDYVLDNNLGGVISWMQSNDAEIVPGSGRRDELTTAIKEGLFGSADLQEYTIKGADQNVSITVTTYSDTSGSGYEFTITNNEAANESGAVLSAVELAYETIKSPKLYIYTQTGATFGSGGYGSGTVTNENGHGVVDLTSVYTTKTIVPGQVVTFRLSASGTASINDITSIELAQSIMTGGAEISRQEIYTGGGELPTIPEETTTQGTNPTNPTIPEETTSTNPGQVAEFDMTTAYVQGDRVSYNGHIYEAKWWTQGEIPGSLEWGAWLLIE